MLLLSFDGEKQHSSLIERPYTLKFLTIPRSSSHNSVVVATSTIIFTTVLILMISWLGPSLLNSSINFLAFDSKFSIFLSSNIGIN